jgi:hypothetical protein
MKDNEKNSNIWFHLIRYLLQLFYLFHKILIKLKNK